MEFSKISSVLISLVALALLHSIHAQDSIKDYLKAHNAARSAVGVGPLKWDNQVARFALHYARKHIHDCDLVHSGGQYGENLATSYSEMFGRDAVNMWVGEKPNYAYDSNSCSPGKSCGHYTQVVWRNSTHLGCAKVRCSNGGTFIGCNYNPRVLVSKNSCKTFPHHKVLDWSVS